MGASRCGAGGGAEPFRAARLCAALPFALRGECSVPLLGAQVVRLEVVELFGW